MTSSRADWTLAGARLTSSVRTKLANTGPSSTSKVSVDARKMRVPTRSDGMRSGVNWRRTNVPPDHLGQRLDGQGLGQPGDAFEQAVAPGQQAHHHPLDHPVLPDDHLLDLEQGLLEGCGGGESGGAARVGHARMVRPSKPVKGLCPASRMVDESAAGWSGLRTVSGR